MWGHNRLKIVWGQSSVNLYWANQKCIKQKCHEKIDHGLQKTFENFKFLLKKVSFYSERSVFILWGLWCYSIISWRKNEYKTQFFMVDVPCIYHEKLWVTMVLWCFFFVRTPLAWASTVFSSDWKLFFKH